MHLSGHSVISTQNENRSIKFWSDVKADGTLQRMMQEAATAVSYGLCFGYDKYGNNRYMIAWKVCCQRSMRPLRFPRQIG